MLLDINSENFIDELLEEWAYKVHDGMPDIFNMSHLIVLKDILKKSNIPSDIIIERLIAISEKGEGIDEPESLVVRKILVPEEPEPKEEESPEKIEGDEKEDVSENTMPSYFYDNNRLEKTENLISVEDLSLLTIAENIKRLPTNDIVVEIQKGLFVKYDDLKEWQKNSKKLVGEEDLVKKKKSGNVYPVQQYDPKKGQALIKKDANPEDVEKAKAGKYVASKEDKPEEPPEKEPTTPEKLDDKQKERLRKIDHDETDKALTFTEDQYNEEEKLRKSGKLLSRGLGTPESRAGEASVHYAIRQLKEGKSIEDIEDALMKIASKKKMGGKNTYLDESWVNGAISTTKLIVKKYGIENIGEVAWDTPSGRKLVGVEGHETPSDMFITVKTKKGMSRIGISLKKNGDVFLVNLGYELALSDLTEGMSDSEKQKISNMAGVKTYYADRDEKLGRAVSTLNKEMKEDLQSSLKKFKSNSELSKSVFGSNYPKYLGILSNFNSLVKKYSFGEKLTADEIKSVSRIIGRGSPIYEKHPNLYDDINLADNRLTSRLLKVFEENPKFAANVKKNIINKVHIKEILNLEQNNKLDQFIVAYGEPPDGAELSKETLLELFGKKTTALYENLEIYEQFQKAETSEEEKKYSGMIIKNINDSIYIDFKDGAKDGVIKVKHEDGKEYPIFTIASRTRGIGAAPVLEVHQTPYMANALKFKTFDIEKWNPIQRVNFLKKLKGEYEERLNANKGNQKAQKEIMGHITRIGEKLKQKQEEKRDG